MGDEGVEFAAVLGVDCRVGGAGILDDVGKDLGQLSISASQMVGLCLGDEPSQALDRHGLARQGLSNGAGQTKQRGPGDTEHASQ